MLERSQEGHMARKTLDQQRVLDVAGEVADREGLDAVTLTRIAEELGVRQPALYRHVEGFDDLIRSLGLRGRKLLAEALVRAAAGVSGEDAVVAVGNAWRNAAKATPGLYAATDRYPCVGDEELQAAVERVVETLSLSLNSFKLSAENRVHAARTMRSAFHGFVHLELGEGHPHDEDLDDSFAHLLELLAAGIRGLEE